MLDYAFSCVLGFLDCLVTFEFHVYPDCLLVVCMHGQPVCIPIAVCCLYENLRFIKIDFFTESKCEINEAVRHMVFTSGVRCRRRV